MVKIADRLHNMRTIKAISKKDKRERIAQETMEIYAPLADRMGMHRIRDELEDLSFKNLNPEARNLVAERLSLNKKNRDDSFKGIKLKVRGNNQNYFIHIRTTGSVLPWQYYDKEFFASNEWNEVELNFSDFKKSSTFMRKKFKASSVKTIGIVAYGREHKAKIEVSEISIY